MFVQVRNLTKMVKRIRVYQPKSPNFRCDYDMMGAIAAGLAVELIISFESTSLGEFADSVKIMSEDDIEIEIPIKAYSPLAKIIFEPFLNLGFIEVQKTKHEFIRFRNEGSIAGNVSLN